MMRSLGYDKHYPRNREWDFGADKIILTPFSSPSRRKEGREPLKPTPPVLVVEEFDRSRSAMRLVAALCLMEFYASFVSSGNSIWRVENSYSVTLMADALMNESARIPIFICTVFLYLCGRGLWRSGRFERHWLLVGIVGVAALILLETVAVTVGPVDTLFLALRSKSDDLASRLLSGMEAASVHLPIWVSLIVLWFVTKPSFQSKQKHIVPWVYCAAAYCLASIPEAISPSGFVHVSFDYAISQFPSVPGNQYVALSVNVALLIVTAVLLLKGSWLARSMALVIATINAVGIGVSWFLLAWLVRIACIALYHRVPIATPIDTSYILTSHDFFWLFVLPAHYLFPWLLIAAYAWRVRMQLPPDDTTPFPRYYCAVCLYNLYGLESEQCPECGSVLAGEAGGESVSGRSASQAR